MGSPDGPAPTRGSGTSAPEEPVLTTDRLRRNTIQPVTLRAGTRVGHIILSGGHDQEFPPCTCRQQNVRHPRCLTARRNPDMNEPLLSCIGRGTRIATMRCLRTDDPDMPIMQRRIRVPSETMLAPGPGQDFSLTPSIPCACSIHHQPPPVFGGITLQGVPPVGDGPVCHMQAPGRHRVHAAGAFPSQSRHLRRCAPRTRTVIPHSTRDGQSPGAAASAMTTSSFFLYVAVA